MLCLFSLHSLSVCVPSSAWRNESVWIVENLICNWVVLCWMFSTYFVSYPISFSYAFRSRLDRRRTNSLRSSFRTFAHWWEPFSLSYCFALFTHPDYFQECSISAYFVRVIDSFAIATGNAVAFLSLSSNSLFFNVIYNINIMMKWLMKERSWVCFFVYIYINYM